MIRWDRGDANLQSACHASLCTPWQEWVWTISTDYTAMRVDVVARVKHNACTTGPGGAVHGGSTVCRAPVRAAHHDAGCGIGYPMSQARLEHFIFGIALWV